MSQDNWTVPGHVVRIVDGDTMIVKLDLGWRISLEQYVRFAGINAPEKNTAGGQAAINFLNDIAKAGDEVAIVSKKILGNVDNYGRVLASVHLVDGRDLSTELINAGHAVEYK